MWNNFIFAVRGTPPVLQIAAENFPPGDVARSELSKDGHRPSTINFIFISEIENKFGAYTIVHSFSLP